MQMGGRGGSAVLGTGDDILFDIFGEANEVIPSALSRWTVESRLLDSASVHDCVNALKPAIIRHLENLQQVEIQEKIAEEKKKKEESKKAVAAASNESVTTSNSTPSTETSTATTTVADSAEMQTTSSTVDSTTTTSAGALVSSVLTSQAFPVHTFSTNQNVAEDMEVSQSETAVAMETTTSTLFTNAISQGVTANGATPVVAGSIADSLITPFNPLPEVLPNAPQRQGVVAPRPQDSTTITTTMMTPAGPGAATSALSMTELLALPPNRSQLSETPQDLPRMNDYRRENAAALTGGLGFTPQVTSSSLMNTPSSELPSVAEILATPADIPSLQQLRSGSLFPQTGGSPATPPQSIRPSLRSNLNRDMVPSPLTVETNMERQGSTDALLNTDSSIATNGENDTVTSSSSVLAADLAAAIMSQLVTSSPTPSITTTAQSVDGERLMCFIIFSIIFSPIFFAILSLISQRKYVKFLIHLV